ncbi:hypothetical protein, variant 1 [Phytophthora nicotianae P10297]|uniref:Uncharacterized protein n=2 Tax=Phytophthora nicotianae P10297 TaxID=1317064 RepID=W2Y9E0_PHYNI|nr:hypothetical protein F442_19784 [Phytophthora nicotianae P10297]ETP31337.1 hypothetical protein, variant 1 [Phytophthora nicotianae P10297]
MFLQKLLDPEDEQRRRIRRARIVRRNRIKREVAKGLPVRKPRLPRALNLDSEAETEEWSEPKSPFRPTFGGNLDGSEQQQQAVNPLRIAAQQSAKSLLSSAATKSLVPRPFDTNALPILPESVPAGSHKRISQHIRAKWQEVYQQVVFNRHEEILTKDPNRKWRQERFGLLLFAKGEYARASEHLSKALSLGATSSLCWRRLAESYYHMWQDGGEWEILWACRAAYEQALTHVAVACSPVALFAYAKVLESLGSFTGALTICASILQTFPNFDQLREVKLRFVLLQRYQLFSPMDPALKLPVLTKCIGYTQELLLDKVITEGPRYITVMYLHTRLNEMLQDLSTPSPVISKPKQGHINVDVLFQELYKLAKKTSEVTPPSGIKWKAWMTRSETYTIFAEYFRSQGESILASDALSRSLELLEESESSQKPANLWRGLTKEQRQKRVALYVVLARNYYQCNQMEKAIRSMEAVFDLDPLHAEARACLVEWFPTKWQYRLELEDASQVQIARVIRGIWGRKIALIRRRGVKRVAEQRYRENPYHLGCRRQVLRLLRDKYASLFAAQEMAARRIQRRTYRYLHYARVRWKLEDQREKTLHDLKSKHQTRKYRYNRQVRSQLAALLPNEYEHRFFREDCAALRIQRCFRGNRTRKVFCRLRDTRRQQILRQHDAAQRIQRFFHRFCRPTNSSPPVDDLLFRAQQKLVRDRERLAAMLLRFYRRWKSANTQRQSVLLYAFQAEATEQHRIIVENSSALKIQRLWRWYTARKVLVDGTSSQAQVFLVEHLFSAQRRQTTFEVDLSRAARKIQAVYRGKRIRRFLRILRARTAALPCASPIGVLISKCEVNHQKGTETMANLYAIDSRDEKRSLFDHPVLVFRGSHVPPRPNSPSGGESFSLQHVISAIQYSSVLKSLICASGDFKGDRILKFLQALQSRRTLRILALGDISIGEKRSTNQAPDIIHDKDIDERSTHTPPSPLGRQLLVLAPPSSPVPHQQRHLSPMQLLSKSVCTSNFLLEELYLERNELLRKPQEGAIVARIVADYFFARYGHLHTLVVAHMHFSDTNGALLGAALAINTVLQRLDLHGNLLCDGAAIAIANDGLTHNKTLQYLNLAENRIGSAGGKALLRCLNTSNRSLQTLILRNNYLTDDVVSVLVEIWQVNAVIESIELSGNLINDGFLTEIHAAVVERREAAPSADNQELRLLFARKRFGIRDVRSPISRRGVGFNPLISPGKSRNTRKKKCTPLSPKKWLSANTPKLISPIAFPTSTRQTSDVFPTTAFAYASPVRPRKLMKEMPLSPARLSKLPALSASLEKKRMAW